MFKEIISYFKKNWKILSIVVFSLLILYLASFNVGDIKYLSSLSSFVCGFIIFILEYPKNKNDDLLRIVFLIIYPLVFLLLVLVSVPSILQIWFLSIWFFIQIYIVMKKEQRLSYLILASWKFVFITVFYSYLIKMIDFSWTASLMPDLFIILGIIFIYILIGYLYLAFLKNIKRK